MKISVIIATFNRRALLARTIPLLLNQQFPAGEYEIVVVVDGSTDGSAEYLRSLKTDRNLRVIEQSNRGQAAAINTGLQAASGELVLFLDDDILCCPTLVAEHAGAERNGKNCLAFGPVLVSAEAKDQLAADWARTYCDRFFDTEVLRKPELGWHGCMASANSSVPRSVLLEVGGLDESFGRGNDVELGIRLLRAGYRFVYRPCAITHQIFQKSRRDVVEDARAEGTAEIRLCRKYPELLASSRIGPVWTKPLWVRQLLRLVTESPVSLEPLLRPFAAVLRELSGVPFCRKAALSFFKNQQQIVAYRSAASEAGSWSTLQREFGTSLPVLMYHAVGPLRKGFDPWLTISPEKFERQLQWLAASKFTPIRVADWIAHQREGKPLPPKPVLLTFDDGYADTAEFALPLLRKYGFTGTVFVVTGEIGGTNSWDLHLGLSEQPLMTAEQIRYWAGQGIEFGAHTRTHADLSKATPDEILTEMKGSRERLEQVTGTPVTSLAYPYGYLNDTVVEVARQCFDAALTCDIGVNYRVTDPMRLKRATVVPYYPFLDMRCMVTLGFNLFLVARIQAGLLYRRMLRWFAPERELESVIE